MKPYFLIELALKQAGIIGEGQTASAETMNDALTLLNMMLASWGRKRWLVFHLLDVAFPGTGAVSYAVGPGLAVNTPRFDRIEGAYVRFLASGPGQPVDQPLDVLTAREDYAAIPVKTISGLPSLVFYDATYPAGTLYVWPVPPAGQYEIHLLVKDQLAQVAKLNIDLNLPAEYQDAILYNLAVRLSSAFGKAPRADTVALAKVALNVLRMANTAIEELSVPAGLGAVGAFNVISGQSR